MGWLAQALVGLFGNLLGWFGKVVTQKVLIVIAVTALVVGLVATLHTALDGWLDTVASNLEVPDSIAGGIALMPSNSVTVLTTIVAAEAALWAFRFARRVAEYRVGA